MADRLVTVARCGTEWEAEQYRDVLAGEGIKAFVEGGQLKSTLFYVGTAIGSVRVVTRDSDAPRAIQILQSLEQTGLGNSVVACHTGIVGFELCAAGEVPDFFRDENNEPHWFCRLAWDGRVGLDGPHARGS